MDAELKTEWCAALRSGKYKQGKFALKTSDRFCCLGVLCDIQGADFDAIKERYGTLSLSENPHEYLGVLGLQTGTLSRMNDDGKSFPEIADYIEKHL